MVPLLFYIGVWAYGNNALPWASLRDQANRPLPHFPVSSSQLSAPHLAHFIQNTYGFERTPSVRLLKAGINHSYLVDNDGHKSVFRVYSHRWRTEEEIAEEIRFLKHLKEDGIPASYPVSDQFGRYVHGLDAPEGTRHAVMFTFAEGGKRLTFSEELHEQCGKVMGRVHKAAEGFRMARAHYNAVALTGKTHQAMQRFVEESSDEAGFVRHAAGAVSSAFSSADATKLRSGAVHLDMWFDNMHFRGDDEVVLFDFDFCGNGWLCLDIGYYLMQIFNTERDESKYLAKSAAFFRGYESVTPIGEEERRLLPAAGLSVFLFYLGVQCARFDDFTSVFMNEIHIQRYVNLILRKWTELHGLDDQGFATRSLTT